MTSLSSIAGQSPRTMMDARISAATAVSKISSTDQTALESALDSIDRALSSGTAGSGDVRSKVDSLITDQVNNGTLTTDQAQELQAFFATGGPQGPHGGPPPPGGEQADAASGVAGTGGVHGGHHCHGGPPPADVTDDTDPTTADASTDTDDTKLQALMAFLTQLRASAQQQSGVYGASASSSSSGKLVSALA